VARWPSCTVCWGPSPRTSSCTSVCTPCGRRRPEDAGVSPGCRQRRRQQRRQPGANAAEAFDPAGGGRDRRRALVQVIAAARLPSENDDIHDCIYHKTSWELGESGSWIMIRWYNTRRVSDSSGPSKRNMRRSAGCPIIWLNPRDVTKVNKHRHCVQRAALVLVVQANVLPLELVLFPPARHHLRNGRLVSAANLSTRPICYQQRCPRS